MWKNRAGFYHHLSYYLKRTNAPLLFALGFALALSGCLSPKKGGSAVSEALQPQATATPTPTPTPTNTPTPTPTPTPVPPPYLQTKNIYGTPSSNFTIVWSGDRPNLRLRFYDKSWKRVGDSTVAANGTVTLPSVVGMYTVALEDLNTHLMSYGQATVTTAVSSWSSVQATTPATAFGTYRIWPSVSMAVGDYTGDGSPDLAILSGTNGAGNTANPGLYLYRYNTGSGQLVADTTLVTTQTVARGLKFIDFDGDGHLDIVFGVHDVASYTQKICRLMNDGTGTFGAAICVTKTGAAATNPYLYDIDVADIDRDGDVDVVSVGGVYNGAAWLNAQAIVWKNNGTTFVEDTVINVAQASPFFNLAIGDFQDDGYLDIITAAYSTSKIVILPQSSAAVFSSATALTTNGSTNYSTLTVGYLNADTKLDVISLNSGSGSNGSVYYSNASDNTLARTAIPVQGEQWGSFTQIADLNVDGNLEIYFPTKNRLLYNNRPGIMVKSVANLANSITVDASSTIAGQTAMGNWAESNALITDFDADGKADFLYFSSYARFFEVLKGQ